MSEKSQCYGGYGTKCLNNTVLSDHHKVINLLHTNVKQSIFCKSHNVLNKDIMNELIFRTGFTKSYITKIRLQLQRSLIKNIINTLCVNIRCKLNEDTSTLLMLHDTWDDIGLDRVITFESGESWDIDIFHNLIACQLNSSNMGNAYPQHPHNPFTRNKYNKKDLSIFITTTIQLNIRVNIAILIYVVSLLNDEFDTNIKPYELVDIFDDFNLRYMKLTELDSMSCTTGIWVPSNAPLNILERNIKKYIPMDDSCNINTLLTDKIHLYSYLTPNIYNEITRRGDSFMNNEDTKSMYFVTSIQ